MRTLNWLAVTLAMAGGFPLLAAETPLGQISQEADVVIRIRTFDATVEKVAALANAIQDGTGDLVSQNATLFGLVLSNPSMAGVDRTKDFYLVLFVREDGEPKALFAIPTTDGPALQKGLPENFVSEVREGWVLYADKDHGVPEAVSESDSLAKRLADSPAHSVMQDSDIGLHLNVDHIAAVYDEKIQEGRQKFEEQVQKGLNTPGVEDAESAVAILKMEADLAFLILEDAETVTIGVNASEEGLEIENYIDFEEGSDVATFLKKQPKSEFKVLSKLGADLPVYMGISAQFTDLAKMASELTASLYKEKSLQQGMHDYIAALEQTPITSAVMSIDLVSGANGLFRSAMIVETKSAAELIASSRQMATSLATIKIGEMTQETKLEPEAETIGTRKVDIMTVKQKMDPKQPGAQMQMMFSNVMFGPNGIQSRMTALADGFLQVQGGGKEAMEAALKSYDANSNSLTDERQGLADQAHLLVLFDLPGLISNAMLAATTVPGIPVPFERAAVEDLQITRSYTATTAVGEDHALRIQTNVPVEQFQGVMKLVEFVQKLQR